MPAIAGLAAVTLDCADHNQLAAFYRDVLGWDIIWSDDNIAYLKGEGEARLGFQRVPNYRPPDWPEGAIPQQEHLELSVPDLAEAETALVRLGATKAAFQPGAGKWTVMLDPAGHPFCITTAV
jgi:catechol 2,3-dioxygenase-like lactoylglutathione lyase family enzyme